MQRLKLILFAAFFPLVSFSQLADSVLSKFFATPLDETVFIRWTITAGNTCDDTHIERSADGINYDRIGLIGGICGSPDQSITYEYTDSLPLVNRTSYYRLKLGYYGYTSAQIVNFFQYNDDGFLLAPNPFTDFTRLLFENDKSEEYNLIISDMQGRIVQEMTTTGNVFIITSNDLGKGAYLFRVRKGGKVIFSGRIVAG